MSSEEITPENEGSTTPENPETQSKSVRLAVSTRSRENIFYLKIFVLEVEDQLRPVDREYDADHIFKFKCEYPSYEEELEARKAATIQNEFSGAEIEYDMLVRWRVRRCLVSWNIHKELPKIGRKLLRQNSLLTDDSLLCVLQLPPLIRKSLLNKLNEALGAY